MSNKKYTVLPGQGDKTNEDYQFDNLNVAKATASAFVLDGKYDTVALKDNETGKFIHFDPKEDLTIEQRFIIKHPEVEKFYVLRYDYDESDSDYRKCMLERPTNEEVDKALDGFAQSMCHYHKMTMRMDLVETKVTDTGLVETVLYTKERTINGKMTE